MQEQIDLAKSSTSESDVKIVIETSGKFSDLAYKDIVLSIDYTSYADKVAFSLIKNFSSDEFHGGNWD